MKNWRFLTRLLIFIGVLGPSIVTTMAGNDGGGVITYSLAGARLGYAALLVLPILTLLYGLTQEMGSRIAIVTGKGLGDIIRERFGVRMAMLIFTILVIANFGALITNVTALRTASEMLSLPSGVFIGISVIFCFFLVTFTKYEKSQKIFLTGMLFYVAYIFSAIKGNPDWGQTVKALFVPTANVFNFQYLAVSIAVLGTTITPWGQFFVQSYMKDKNIAISKLKYAKLEAFLGAFLSDLFSFFIIIATAASLFAHKITLESGEQAALAIRPFAGNLAGILFAIGLANAAIIGITIVSLSSAYAFSEFFGFTGSLDKPYKKGRRFYLYFLVTMILASVLVLTSPLPLFKVVLYTQSLNGVLLPFLFYFILKIINDRNLMGKYVNGKISNLVTKTAMVFIVVVSLLAVVLAF